MRPIAGSDILDFYASSYDLLVLTADGEYAHIDGDGDRGAYDYIWDGDTEVQILLQRSTITDGDWFPDALNEAGDLDPAAADDMAAIITSDGILPGRALKAVDAGKAWTESEKETNRLAAARAVAVAEVVAYAGSQTRAAQVLGLDQSTVNKLVKKARAAQAAATAKQTTEYGVWDTAIPGGATLRAGLLAFLGDAAATTDVDAVEDDYRAAVNEALAPIGVTLAGDMLYGPHPRTMDLAEITAIIEDIDLGEIVARHDEPNA